jgi:nickel-dependent lactate racemase
MTTDNQTISLAYGKGDLSIKLPENIVATVIRKHPLEKIPDQLSAVLTAFEQPIGSKSLRDLALGRKSACILVCDITRPVPNGLFLRPMIEILIAAGIPAAKITVLIATGLHRPNEGDELAEVIGDPWVLENVAVENHFARNEEDHVDLGLTPTRKTPVKINRRFVDADLRISTGLVEPHFMAGWSGGRKVVAPGVAHHETIRTFHSARFMADPLAVQCNLVGNPLHEEQLEIVRMIGDVYALNTVIDEERDLVHVTFGEVIESHLAAVNFIKQTTHVPIDRKFSTVITSSAGYPLDKTYYQTIKGMVTPLDILAPGGTLIMVSECSEGFGSTEFREAQERLLALGPERFLATLMAKSFADIDEWQSQMQVKTMRIGRIVLYAPRLSDDDRASTAVEFSSNLQDSIVAAIDGSADRSVAVIPEGPYVVPYHAPLEAA